MEGFKTSSSLQKLKNLTQNKNIFSKIDVKHYKEKDIIFNAGNIYCIFFYT